jgi:LysM repeat protein
MRQKKFLSGLLFIVILSGFLLPGIRARASQARTNLAQSGGVTAFDLILAMNTLRVSYGLPALIEDPIVNAVAQNTAAIMAANQMSGHIGDVRGRLAAAGYGGGATVWATENFAVGSSMGIDQIMLVWSDPDHMRPAVNPAYCHVGAGVAKAANGQTYYVLQAAYIAGQACGDYVSPSGGGNTGGTGVNPVPQIIIPVKIATPDSDGIIYHEVASGQSFWAIAVAYKTTIKDLEYWNNLSRETPLQVGQRLFIPSNSTAGYATPTPVGLVIPSTPDAGGKIIHKVEPYHTLITISQAYKVPVDTIVALNGIQVDWPLQIGQQLLISPGNFTPTPPLTPLEMLTPDSAGNYSHTVLDGETLSGIAGFYEVPLADLLAWNNLNYESIIRPGEKLALEVTPPTPTPTSTPTSAPATATSPSPSATPTLLRTPIVQKATTPVTNDPGPADSGQPLMIGIGLSALGLILLFGMWVRKKM